MTVKFYHDKTATFLRAKLGELLEEHPQNKRTACYLE